MSALRLTWDNFIVAIQVEIASARIAESGCPLWGARGGTVSEGALLACFLLYAHTFSFQNMVTTLKNLFS
jgi:hypothetical protein